MLFSKIFGKSVAVREIVLLEELLVLGHVIRWENLFCLRHNLLVVFPDSDILLDKSVLFQVTVHKDGGDVDEALYALALFGKFQDSPSAIVIYLESVRNRVIEIDTCSRADENIYVINHHLPVFGGYSKTLLHEVTVYWDDFLPETWQQFGPLCEKRNEELA